MLPEPVRTALHHIIGTPPLQKHPDQRRSRQDLSHLIRDPSILIPLHYLRFKTRTVVAVHPQNPLLQRSGTAHRRKHRQISAFGMAPQIQIPRQMPRRLPHIPCRIELSHHRFGKCQRKIFLPAHQVFIGPPVSDIIHLPSFRIFPQKIRDRGKLYLHLLIQNIDIII